MRTPPASTDRAYLVLPLTGLLLGLTLSAVARAQNMRDLVEAALDEKITQRIEISERPLRDALSELEKVTGLHFELHTAAVDWMPYGEQTRLAIVIQDMSVRRALQHIFGGLGLSLRVADDRVMVEPAPVLDRMGRRLTIDEVNLLQKLAGEPWSTLKPNEFAVEFRVPPGKENPQQVFEQAMREGPPTDALTQLETVTQRLGWLWMLSGKTIVLYSRTEDIQQRLDRPLDLNYQRVSLDNLLVDLGKRIDITVHFEPGALQKVAARDRHVDLVQRGTTMRQVLELIVGNTGLWYEVVEDGIVVGAKPPGAAEGEPAGEQPQRVVAVLRIPVGTDGTTIDFLIRADELPAEFKALRDRKLPEVIKTLQEQAQP